MLNQPRKEEMLDQGSHEWLQAREGRITASDSSLIITATGKPSSSEAVQNYAFGLALMGIYHNTEEHMDTWDMQRGKALEPHAAKRYERETKNDTTISGFWILGEHIGASPDRLVGEDGLVEIKCPNVRTMTGYLRDIESLKKKYFHQVQFQMLVTGRKWCDLYAYCEDLWKLEKGKKQPATRLIRIDRDEDYINKLVVACENVIELKAQYAKGIKGE